ncbi:MAG: hypothetical protein AAFR42_04930 [Cyanobacteria bacterium J06628_6]
MKRYILSALTVLVATTAVVPASQAFKPEASLQDLRLEALDSRTKRQVSTPEALSEDASLFDLVRHNRRIRDKS